jgi:succinate dehydrogenase/fumarate reductase cytochrome b subunit
MNRRFTLVAALAVLAWPWLLHYLGTLARAARAAGQPLAHDGVRLLALLVALALPALGAGLVLSSRGRADDNPFDPWVAWLAVVTPPLFVTPGFLSRFPAFSGVPHATRLAWIALVVLLLLPAVLGHHRRPPPARQGPERWLAGAHRLSAVVLVIYALLHLTNHLLAFVSLELNVRSVLWTRALYKHPVFEALLLAAIPVQIVTGLRLVWRRRDVVLDGWGRLQLLAGLYLAAFLAVHTFATAVLHRDLTFFAATNGARGMYHSPSLLVYYALGPLAVLVHLTCALRAAIVRRWGRDGGDRTGRALLVAAALVATLIAVAAGGFHLRRDRDRPGQPATIPAVGRAALMPKG